MRIATNTSGPRRFGYGTFRDYVIGLTAMTAEGRVFHSGGRVVKNVAGYDLCKLLVGSLGTLAVVTQVTLKLKPLPESSILVAAGFENVADRDAAVSDLLNSQTRPIAIETLNRAAADAVENHARAGLPNDGWLLLVGFEGSPRETEWQAETWNKELAARHPKQQTRDPRSGSGPALEGADRIRRPTANSPFRRTCSPRKSPRSRPTSRDWGPPRYRIAATAS